MTEAPTETSNPPKRKGIPRPLLIGFVVAVLGLGFWVYNSFKDDFWPKRFGEVVPGMIYRSGQISPRIIEKTLKDRDIKTIINLQVNQAGADAAQDAEIAAADRLGIKYYRYSLSGDGTGAIINYADALDAMIKSEQEHKPVLIHCAAGTQRTGVAIAFYRVLVQNKPAAEAYDEMLKYDTNPRKDAPALNYLNDHMAELGQMLLQRGLIEKVPSPLPHFDFAKQG